MKSLTIILVFALHAVGTLAWTSIGNYSDPAHPGKCVKGDLVISPGRTYPKGELCWVKICLENGMIKTLGCGTYRARKGCVVGDYVDRNADYPKCCKRKASICPEASAEGNVSETVNN